MAKPSSTDAAVWLILLVAAVWVVWGLLTPTSVTTTEDDAPDSSGLWGALQAGLDATNATLAAAGLPLMVAPGRTQ